jgi:thioredoxin reductase (NADPH)
LNATVLKTVDGGNVVRGFESLPLRRDRCAAPSRIRRGGLPRIRWHAYDGHGALTDSYDIVVAGGGIAGLAAAVAAARFGRRTLVLTGGVPGGLLLSIERIEGVAGFPEGVPGYELCPATQEQGEAAGAHFEMAALERLTAGDDGITIETAEGQRRARAVILATGARFRALEVPGEERLANLGVSTCASCDAPLLSGAEAAVVGGGDSALQEALTLAEQLERVVILVRGDALRAQATFRDRIMSHPKVEIRYGTVVEEILGETRVSGVRVREPAGGHVEQIEVAAVFPFVGLAPNTEQIDERVTRDAGGRLVTDGAFRTTLPGVFAAGIVRSGAAARAAAAAGEGATAALAADEYLATGRWPERVDPAAVAAAGTGGANG